MIDGPGIERLPIKPIEAIVNVSVIRPPSAACSYPPPQKRVLEQAKVRENGEILLEKYATLILPACSFNRSSMLPMTVVTAVPVLPETVDGFPATFSDFCRRPRLGLRENATHGQQIISLAACRDFQH